MKSMLISFGHAFSHSPWLVQESMPVIMFMIVDLPLPEGPTMATMSPSAIVRSMPRSAGYSSLPVR